MNLHIFNLINTSNLMSTPKSIHALIHYKLHALHESGCCCMLHTFLMMIEQQNSGGEASVGVGSWRYDRVPSKVYRSRIFKT